MNYPSFDELFDRAIRPKNIARIDFAFGRPPREECRKNEVYMLTYLALHKAAKEAQEAKLRQ